MRFLILLLYLVSGVAAGLYIGYIADRKGRADRLWELEFSSLLLAYDSGVSRKDRELLAELSVTLSQIDNENISEKLVRNYDFLDYIESSVTSIFFPGLLYSRAKHTDRGHLSASGIARCLKSGRVNQILILNSMEDAYPEVILESEIESSKIAARAFFGVGFEPDCFED